MILVICDVCNTQVQSRLGETLTLVVGERVFDIGPCCLDKPFRVPPSARPYPRPRKGQEGPVKVQQLV